MTNVLPKDYATFTNMDRSAFNAKTIGGKKKIMRKITTTYKKKIDAMKKWLQTSTGKTTGTYKRGGKRGRTTKRRK
jgi:hypothetical protein